jgi:hypothetical protein
MFSPYLLSPFVRYLVKLFLFWALDFFPRRVSSVGCDLAFFKKFTVSQITFLNIPNTFTKKRNRCPLSFALS